MNSLINFKQVYSALTKFKLTYSVIAKRGALWQSVSEAAFFMRLLRCARKDGCASPSIEEFTRLDQRFLNKFPFLVIIGLLGLLITSVANARLEVCNNTDLVLMVAVGYDTGDERTASEGWWRIYPGFCEVPVDVAMLKGDYYLHAESNPRSTMPVDSFTWGTEKPLCVQLADFRIPDGNFCDQGNTVVNFNVVKKNWRNYNKIDIYYDTRKYQNEYRTKIAGIQRMLSMLGYDIGEIDGLPGENTIVALNEIGQTHKVFGFDFRQFFPLLERLIAEKQKLDG